MQPPQFTGVVLTGGQSRRMGTDKAFLEVGGQRLVDHALDALCDAAQRLVVGGTDPRLEETAAAAGAVHIADRWPGEGPLGAVATALGNARYPVTVVLPCDLPGISPEDVALLFRAIHEAMESTDGEAPVAAVFTDDRRHYLPLAINSGAGAVAEQLFESGSRSMTSLLDELSVIDVPAPSLAVADIDSPDDLQPGH